MATIQHATIQDDGYVDVWEGDSGDLCVSIGPIDQNITTLDREACRKLAFLLNIFANHGALPPEEN